MCKSNPNSRLKVYTAAASSILVGTVSAQNIQYVDVNPDVILDKNSGPHIMDFNGDTGPDMTFEVANFNSSGSSTYSGVPFTFVYNGSQAVVQPGPLGGAQGVISGTSTFGVSALNSGDSISATHNFSSQPTELGVKGSFIMPALSFTNVINQGEFLGASEKFLGMKFSAAGNIHYGWVRLSIDTTNVNGLKLMIHDFAYNPNPDQGLLAGEMPSASVLAQVALEEKVNIKITPDKVLLNVTPDLIGGEVRLVSIDGKSTNSFIINDINSEFLLEHFETGIYLVQNRNLFGSGNF
jgi:hypothetical protein